ncbi:shikimate kinase [Arboricoccus pini]|uniref:Shikimate kinase n=1 Tax=Arboricoccus pini TaxID=1963835 RepID=A0A212S2D2_9PROT|nr:shikimate kinase [Arboricoccus pini]SNB79111.1 shikimate kinase [Arboricoccus pini]
MSQAMQKEAMEGTVQPPPPLARTLVFVGLMGAGKTSVGRRVARLANADFVDADDEIVAAAGCSIPEIFESFGEEKFRDLERRVVARLLEGPPIVLSLGGGAFMDDTTRTLVLSQADSVWLKAELDILLSRVLRKRQTRPLLAKGDPAKTLAALIEERHPVYALADHVVESGNQSADAMATEIVALLREKGVLAGASDAAAAAAGSGE